jgi:cohesin complex subunit SA-1/2
MVEHAIRFLTAHIMWKTRGLTRSDNLSPEERAHREKLRAQRDALVGKTREYAIGTQSNAIEGVKRAVRCSHITISPHYHRVHFAYEGLYRLSRA